MNRFSPPLSPESFSVRDELCLDLVSPLPPVRSGIADYSLDLLPELASRCRVRVVRLPSQPVSEAVVERWRPIPVEELGRGGGLPLYQMGNNVFHTAVMDLAFATPGVVCLHDLFLHHLLVERSLAQGKLEPYAQSLAYDHGWLGAAVAQPPRWGGYGQSALFALPAHRRLVQGQRGVLVHSAWSASLLREEVEGVSVRVIPMPMPPGPVVDAAQARSLKGRWDLPDGVPVLGSFGFQTPIKRTLSVIRALAQPGLEKVHMLVVGEVSKTVDLEGVARSCGLAERIHITGFLPKEDLPLAMACVDLCVNLRYPTAGETSASLLRIFAHGRGAVVSDYGQFADVPDEVALRIPLGEGEAEALAHALRSTLNRPLALRRMGEAARELVRLKHDPARVADAVVEACLEWRERPPPGAWAASVAPPTSLTWGSLPGRLEVEGIEPPWPEGELRQIQARLSNTGFARWLAGEREEGGVALEVCLLAGEEDLLKGRPWLPLPRDLSPGESHVFRIPLRRPLGASRLRVEPHVLGGHGFSALDGPVWEGEV